MKKVSDDMKKKSIIKSVELSLYHNYDEDLTKLDIPISNIEILEIDKITSKIIYLKDGHYDNIDKCGCLELKIRTDNLDENTIKILSEDICLFTVSIEFDDCIKHYNLPYDSDDGELNNYQYIKYKDNTIYILVDEDSK